MNVALEKSWKRALDLLKEKAGEVNDPESYIRAIRRKHPGEEPGKLGLWWWEDTPARGEALKGSRTAPGWDPVERTQNYLKAQEEASRHALGAAEAHELVEEYRKAVGLR